jgi:hemoglobin
MCLLRFALATRSLMMQVTTEQEAAIDWMVRSFYERSFADPVLGPIFREAIHDFEPHVVRVVDFWCDMIHSTERYKGNVYAAHMKLNFEPEAFERWIATLESAANDSLEPHDAAKAVRIANHMAGSFKVGMFPFTGKDGRPSRVP